MIPGFGTFTALPDDTGEDTATGTVGPFRPPQWSQGEPQTIVFAPPAEPAGTLLSDGTRSDGTPTQYVFDAVLRALHDQTAKGTEHPVQSGANIIDHIYMLPARLQLEVGFSDAMDQFSAGMYSGSVSKSVSAYQTFIALQLQRQPLSIKTRLRTYDNMFIESIVAPDDYRTKFGLKATIVFKEIILATNNTTPSSARPDSTDSTSEGTKASVVPDPSTGSTYNLSPTDVQNVLDKTNGLGLGTSFTPQNRTIGAGFWSSNPKSTLPAN